MLKSNYLKHKVNYEVDKSVCQHLRIIHVLQHYFTINGRWQYSGISVQYSGISVYICVPFAAVKILSLFPRSRLQFSKECFMGHCLLSFCMWTLYCLSFDARFLAYSSKMVMSLLILIVHAWHGLQDFSQCIRIWCLVFAETTYIIGQPLISKYNIKVCVKSRDNSQVRQFN